LTRLRTDLSRKELNQLGKEKKWCSEDICMGDSEDEGENQTQQVCWGGSSRGVEEH
jgi:hypothetical protein